MTPCVGGIVGHADADVPDVPLLDSAIIVMELTGVLEANTKCSGKPVPRFNSITCEVPALVTNRAFRNPRSRSPA
jgi:hypothetical protein